MTRVLAQEAHLKPKATLVVNTNNPLVEAIYRIRDKEPKVATEMAHGIFDMAKLTSHELSQEELSHFVERWNTLTLTLAEKLM